MKASGTEVRAALRKASVWNTAVACGAGHGLLVRPHSIKRTRESHPDDSLGMPFSHETDDGLITAQGSLPCYLRYDGLDLALALAMGATGGAPVRQGTTAAYAQTLVCASHIDALFATLAVENGVDVEEFPSAKLHGFTLKGSAGKPVECEFHVIADERVPNSTVNTPASMDSVTFVDTGNRVLFTQMVMRMNDSSGLALGAGDAIYPSSFEITFRRALRGVHASGQADRIDEPTNDGKPEVSVRLTFPRYGSNAHFLAWNAATRKKLELAFTGATIEGAYKRTFTVQLPALAYTGVDLPVVDGIMEHPLEFRALSVAAAVAGMSGVTGPLGINLINKQIADVLA